MLKNSLTALSLYQESFLFVLIAISFGNRKCPAYSLLFPVILLVLVQLSIFLNYFTETKFCIFVVKKNSWLKLFRENRFSLFMFYETR